jgi:hypothetical protein
MASRRRRHTPEQIIRKLREGEKQLGQGVALPEVLKHLEITEATWYHRSQPIRSAITVAGIVGHAANNSRIRGSTASTIDPAGCREYFGGPSEANAALTVFFEHPNTRAITLIGIFSARCNRLI